MTLRKNEGVKMESTGASRESSRPPHDDQLSIALHGEACRPARRADAVAEAITAWITRKPVGSRVSVSLKLSGFMTYP